MNLHFPLAGRKVSRAFAGYIDCCGSLEACARMRTPGSRVRPDKAALMEVSCKPDVNLDRYRRDERYTFTVALSWR